MQTIGQTLRKLKESGGYSASDICRAINTTTSLYLKVERDQREVSFIMMYRICRFYEISMHEFADLLSAAELERSDLSTLRVLKKRGANEANIVSINRRQ